MDPAAGPPEVPGRDPLTGLTAVELADLILYTVVEARARTTVIEPTDTYHVVRVELDGVWTTCASIETSLGDATVARLAILANLPIRVADNRVGRLSLRVVRDGAHDSDDTTEVVVAVRTTEMGVSAEIHGLGSPRRAGADSLEPARMPDGTSTGPSGTFGHYRVVEELGRGGMGVVYRAEHTVLEKMVALKVMHAELAKKPALATQLVVEGRAAARVRHPGIVDVTDFGIATDGRPFIVMELVDAPTLSQLLEQGAMAQRRAVLLMQRIASALRASAARGVIHRDLTPANIFVLDGDQPKITDFGLARIRDESTDSNPMGHAVVGTPHYMSPEQGRGEEADVRSDIYSLGCVLFTMLTGDPPFVAGDPATVLLMHRNQPPPKVVGPDGPAPDVLQRIVGRAMEKLPSARYQSIDEMLLDLDRAERALERDGWRRWLPT